MELSLHDLCSENATKHSVYFPHCSIKGLLSGKKKTLNINFVCLFHLQLLYETFVILRRIERGLHVKYPLFLSDFKQTSCFPTLCQINPEISELMKIHPVKVESFKVDGQTD